MGKTLFDKVWDLHTVKVLETGQTQLFIGLHLIHEVTSPQAFQMLRERNLNVLFPERTVATVDHIVPTENAARPFSDPLAEEMMGALESNTEEFGILLYGIDSAFQGIVHVVGPELGLTQPGMTIACGDSHTSTHGAFGALAFGVGTSEVRDILATQTIALNKPKVRRIRVTGRLRSGVFAKDVILKIINRLGIHEGAGYAYEYAGDTIENLDMEARMTICNMSIEGGARFGYVNPDKVTVDYIKGRKYAPNDIGKTAVYWKSLASDADAVYDDEIILNAGEIEPMVTWGIHPGQSTEITERMPMLSALPENERESARQAYRHMGFSEGQHVLGVRVDVAFIGSCTNGRISDFREAAEVVRGRRVAPHVRALAVPGSRQVARQAAEEGLDRIFTEAGFEWRSPGCSLCLAMNPDRLEGSELCASSSNRNFIGRQGSPTGRTLLMSPAMVAAAAVRGEVADVRNA